MSDLISRAEVLKLLDEMEEPEINDYNCTIREHNITLDKVACWVEDLPSVSADRPKFKLELITDIVRQLGHLDDYVANTCDRPKGEWIDREDSKPEPYIPEASTERVVHCKDCIYSRQPEGEELFVCENRFGMSGWVREDEFCSSGSL